MRMHYIRSFSGHSYVLFFVVLNKTQSWTFHSKKGWQSVQVEYDLVLAEARGVRRKESISKSKRGLIRIL